MKAWWINLSLRDKRFLSVGAIFLGLFFCYEIFFASLSDANQTLRETISHQKTLLAWMQMADQRIENFSDHHTTHKNPAALLSLLQKQINISPFAKNLQLLTQAENNSVKISFQKINFDTFITWLTHLWQEEGITVTQMTTTPNGAPGIVDVTLLINE